jgi:hypothetical protein
MMENLGTLAGHTFRGGPDVEVVKLGGGNLGTDLVRASLRYNWLTGPAQ